MRRIVGYGPAVSEAERQLGPSGSCVHKATHIGVPLPQRLPQVELVTVLYMGGKYQLSHIKIDGRVTGSVNTSGWTGERVDRLERMVKRIYATGAL